MTKTVDDFMVARLHEWGVRRMFGWRRRLCFADIPHLEAHMTRTTAIIIAGLSLCACTVATASAAEMSMPKQCSEDSDQMAMSKPMDMPGMQMKDFQKEFMASMQKMDPAMMQGMMKSDPDTAFVCGMIAHHMGAISMSEVELKYGRDAANKALAQRIIDDQTKEIDEMKSWLEKNAK